MKFMKKHEIIKLMQVDPQTAVEAEPQAQDSAAEQEPPSAMESQAVASAVEPPAGVEPEERGMELDPAGAEPTGAEAIVEVPTEPQDEDCGMEPWMAAPVGVYETASEPSRDLKRENIPMMSNGYSKLTEFGFAKILEPDSRTHMLCGTPEYIASEVSLNEAHGKPIDWWTLGILIYEMIVGQPPFCDEDPIGIYQKILAGKVYFTKYLDSDAKSLVKHLLRKSEGW